MFFSRTFSPLALVIALVSSTSSRDLAGYLSAKFDSLQNTASEADTIIPMVVDWPAKYAHLQTGTVWTTFDCFGVYGYPYAKAPYGPIKSFEYPAGSGTEYLYGGALWVGGIVDGDTLVSVGMDGWKDVNEFRPTSQDGNHGTIDSIGYALDYSLRALFTDTITSGTGLDPYTGPHKPLPIRVAIHAHHMQTPPANDFVIYDLMLTNIGNRTIEKGWVGIMMDCDVGHNTIQDRFVDDIAGSLHNESIAYVADNNGDFFDGFPPAVSALSMKLLATSFASLVNFNWWISNGAVELDFGPRLRPTAEDPWRDFAEMNLGTPVSQRDKYYILSHKEWDYDQVRTATISVTDTTWMPPYGGLAGHFTDGFDARFLLSAGPFDLAPGASSRIIFAMSAADTLHHVPGNLNNLPNSPDAYLANLNFTGMITNMHLADSLSTIILDPMLPTLGLREVVTKEDSTVIEWDPWVFPEVVGYDLLVEEVTPAELPYPGVAPPWLTISGSATVTELGDTYQHTLHGLDPQKFYKIAVANRTALSTGQSSRSVTVTPHQRALAPQFANEFVFLHNGESMMLNWTVPTKAAIDHYNIYKFADSIAASKKFQAFYDKGYARPARTPMDSFTVDGTKYWYYQMTPYAQIAGNQSSYTDPGFTTDAIYVVTSVDAGGFESEFSMDVYAHALPVRDRHILLFTGYGKGTGALVSIDTIRNFYDSILNEWSHDTYVYVDSINLQSCNEPYALRDNCVDWHDFMRYDLVIFDDILLDGILRPIVARNVVRRILLSGGKVASFGPLSGMYFVPLGMPPTTRFINDPIVTRFFGIDSVRQMGPLYPPVRPDPKIDTVHGFVLAEPALMDIPAVRLDSLRTPASALVYQRFPASAGPGVATFVIDSTAEVTHWYRSEFPAFSTNEGQIVGLRSSAEGCETWLFGFHLWYMRHGQARDLIHRILTGQRRQSVLATIETEPAYGYYARRVGGKTGTLRLGNISDGHAVSDIDPATIRINGTLPVAGGEIAPHVVGFTGEVLSATFQLDSLVKMMEPLGTKSDREIAVDGSYTDATPFHTVAYLQTVGRYSGDANGDYQLNIADITAIVSWFYHGGPQPTWTRLIDANGDCRVNIVDITYVISYLFRGGAPTRYCGP
jgi:hypothetical protein